jgi:hypothetical protein
MTIGKNVLTVKAIIIMKFYVRIKTVQFFIEELKLKMIFKKRLKNFKDLDGNGDSYYETAYFLKEKIKLFMR